MRCKVGDLCIAVGPPSGGPRDDYYGFRGLIVEVVGPSQDPRLDWSVRVPGHPCPTWPDGTWAAMDCDLVPLRDGDEQTETPAEIIRELTEQGS